jgi:hypothetical protein
VPRGRTSAVERLARGAAPFALVCDLVDQIDPADLDQPVDVPLEPKP